MPEARREVNPGWSQPVETAPCSSPAVLAAPSLRLPLKASVRVHLPFVLTNQSAALAALGDHTRRAIVACLAERPRAVGELADELPVSRPAVSQHLKVLKDAGLVTERAAGTRRIYRLNPVGVGALRDQLEVFWNRALASYKDVVDEPKEDGS
jgi:DNA-binding transcriptional ArsR family regulator